MQGNLRLNMRNRDLKKREHNRIRYALSRLAAALVQNFCWECGAVSGSIDNVRLHARIHIAINLGHGPNYVHVDHANAPMTPRMNRISSETQTTA
jgi:hypothetical protein